MAELLCFKCKQVVPTMDCGTIKKPMKTICEKCLRDWYGDEDHYAVGGPMVALIMDAFGGDDEK